MEQVTEIMLLMDWMQWENVNWRGEIKRIGKLGSNDTTKIGMLPSASKYISIRFSDQCIHIINNK